LTDGETSGDDHDAEGRAPICPYCGVTALPADPAHVIDTRFICENPDCDAFGDAI
jgi:hypothetical protein